VRAYVDALNAGDLAALDAIAADDFVIHQPAGDRRGKGALRAFVAGVRRLLPDIEARIGRSSPTTPSPTATASASCSPTKGPTRSSAVA